MKLSRNLIAPAALALSLMFATVALAGALEVGKMAPDFTLTDQMGKSHTLSEYRGNVVVLEWVNPDCPFVKRHYDAGTMKSLAAEYGAKDVVWLTVNSTKYFDQQANAEFTKKRDLAYPVLDDHSGDVGRLYHAKTTPHMFVVDAKGMVAYNGAIDDDPRGQKDEATNFVDAALTSVLKGETVERASTKPYGCSVKYAEPTKAAKVKASS